MEHQDLDALTFEIASGARFDAGRTLATRIQAAYRAGLALDVGTKEGMWLDGTIPTLRRDVHERLLDPDVAVLEAMLADPGSTDLQYGFEDNARSLGAARDDKTRRDRALGAYRQLILLVQALGGLRLGETALDLYPYPTLDRLLDRLVATLGIEVAFPNPFPGEEGLGTARGILTYRATQAIYQAWRIRQLTAHVERPRILEIGAGSGRTAYYAWQLGIRDYTIIDLPITCAASANFLARTLGPDQVGLYGEDRDADIEIVPAGSLQELSGRFDLVLNADSLTEMSRDTAQELRGFQPALRRPAPVHEPRAQSVHRSGTLRRSVASREPSIGCATAMSRRSPARRAIVRPRLTAELTRGSSRRSRSGPSRSD